MNAHESGNPEADDSGHYKCSPLGTLDYWEKHYELETKNIIDFNDKGEVWFGASCQKRVLSWIANNISDTSVAIIDIGCGNGSLLFDLAKIGYSNLCGLDYSKAAIQLCESTASDLTEKSVQFLHADILTVNCLEVAKVDVVVDKGTFDAISLMEDRNKAMKTYVEHIGLLLKNSTFPILMITSCNFTKTELMSKYFADWTIVDELHSPQFSFGGSLGQTVTSLVLRPMHNKNTLAACD